MPFGQVVLQRRATSRRGRHLGSARHSLSVQDAIKSAELDAIRSAELDAIRSAELDAIRSAELSQL
jgi:hypothetical protein